MTSSLFWMLWVRIPVFQHYLSDSLHVVDLSAPTLLTHVIMPDNKQIIWIRSVKTEMYNMKNRSDSSSVSHCFIILCHEMLNAPCQHVFISILKYLQDPFRTFVQTLIMWTTTWCKKKKKVKATIWSLYTNYSHSHHWGGFGLCGFIKCRMIWKHHSVSLSTATTEV